MINITDNRFFEWQLVDSQSETMENYPFPQSQILLDFWYIIKYTQRYKNQCKKLLYPFVEVRCLMSGTYLYIQRCYIDYFPNHQHPCQCSGRCCRCVPCIACHFFFNCHIAPTTTALHSQCIRSIRWHQYWEFTWVTVDYSMKVFKTNYGISTSHTYCKYILMYCGNVVWPPDIPSIILMH